MMHVGGRPVGEGAEGFDLAELLEAVRAAATPEELVSASEAISVVPTTLGSNRRAAQGTAVRGPASKGRRAGARLGAAVVVTVFTASASLAITGQLPQGARDVAAGYVAQMGLFPVQRLEESTQLAAPHTTGEPFGPADAARDVRPMWMWVSQPQGDEGIDPPRVDPAPVDPPPVIDPRPVDPPPVVEPPPGDDPPPVIDPPPGDDPPPVVDPPPVIDPPPGEDPPPVVDPPPAVDPPGEDPPPAVDPPGEDPPPAVDPPGEDPPPAVDPPGEDPPPVVDPPGEGPPPVVDPPPGNGPPFDTPPGDPPPFDTPPGDPPPFDNSSFDPPPFV
jgi:hypothetical protein